jgi:hypothetical protein
MSSSPPTTIIYVPTDGSYHNHGDWGATNISFLVIFGVFFLLMIACIVGDYTAAYTDRRKRQRLPHYDTAI